MPTRPDQLCVSQSRTAIPAGNHPMLNNVHLMEAMAGQRDVRAFSELYRRFAPRAFALAHSITRQPEDAADAVQESMLRLWMHASACRPEQIDPWLRKIVIRESIKKLKRKPIPFSPKTESPEKALENTPYQKPEIQVEDSELEAGLRSLVCQLPKRDRTMLTLYFWDGCSQNSIADKLAMPQRTVSLRLKSIIHHLRSRLAEIGWPAWTSEQH